MSGVGNARPALSVTVWTMATAGLDEAAVAPWARVLDGDERARAARFVFASSRVTFIAAHALARAALAAAAGVPAADFGFRAGEHGKPAALLGARPAGLAFNLSHTAGLVGIAVAPNVDAKLALGFDVEPLERRAPLEVARHYFTEGEVAGLEGLAEERRAERFFRLWTLKEAFIKATGKGLTQDLATFWFTVEPPAIGIAASVGEDVGAWAFEQRLVAGGFVAALGARVAGSGLEVAWRDVEAARFDPETGVEAAAVAAGGR
jgi:4'-phosphopantetheinyl transferase